MTVSLSPSALTLNLHAMPCTNACAHCWVQGSARKPRMPFEQIAWVLGQLAGLKGQGIAPGFFLFDEPTHHPRFLDILQRAADLDLLPEGFFVATNGSILAHRPDAYWEAVRQAGLRSLQLTLYGLEATHDAFAGRTGAFRDVVTTARRGLAHGMELVIQVIWHADNTAELAQTLDFARGLDPSGATRAGYFVFAWQGRGRRARRPRRVDYARLPGDLKRRLWVEEREAVGRICADAQLAARRADELRCQSLVLDVEHDLRVYGGGACDTGGVAGAVPELRREFALGTLDARGLGPLLEAYLREPPRAIRWLREITWGELAERYGDRDERRDLPPGRPAVVEMGGGLSVGACAPGRTGLTAGRVRNEHEPLSSRRGG